MLATRSNSDDMLNKLESYLIGLTIFFKEHSFPSVEFLPSNTVKTYYYQSLDEVEKQFKKFIHDIKALFECWQLDLTQAEVKKDLPSISMSQAITNIPLIWQAVEEVLFHLKVIANVKYCEDARAKSDEIILAKINIIKKKLRDCLKDEYKKKTLDIDDGIINMLKGDINSSLEVMDYFQYQRFTQNQLDYLLIVTDTTQYPLQLPFVISFAWCLRAFVYHFSNREDYSIASSFYEMAIKQDSNPIALNNRAHMYVNGHGSEKKEAKAIELYKEAENKHNFALARLNRALLHNAKREYESALKLLGTVLEDNPVPPCVLALASFYYNIIYQVSGMPDKFAKQVLYAKKALVGNYFASICAKVCQAKKYMDINQYEAAVILLDEVINFHYSDSLYLRLKIHLEDLFKITPALYAFLSDPEFHEGDVRDIYNSLFLRLGIPKVFIKELIDFFDNQTELNLEKLFPYFDRITGFSSLQIMTVVTLALSINKTIKKVSFIPYEKDNHRFSLGDTHCPYIAFILKNNSAIEIMHLPGNRITSKGMQFLVRALKFNRALQEIDLSNNEIKDCKGLLEIIEVNRTLKVVDLQENKLTEDNLLHIGKILNSKPNCPLIRVGVEYKALPSSEAVLSYLLGILNAKSLYFLLKYAPLIDGACDKLPKKVEATTERSSYWDKLHLMQNKFAFFKFRQMSLLDLCIMHIYQFPEDHMQQVFKKLPLELQKQLELLPGRVDFNYSLYALDSILRDYQRECFVRSLTESDDLCSHVALGIYYFLTDKEKTLSLFSLVETKLPGFIKQFLDEAFDRLIITKEDYGQLQSLICKQTSSLKMTN